MVALSAAGIAAIGSAVVGAGVAAGGMGSAGGSRRNQKNQAYSDLNRQYSMVADEQAGFAQDAAMQQQMTLARSGGSAGSQASATSQAIGQAPETAIAAQMYGHQAGLGYAGMADQYTQTQGLSDQRYHEMKFGERGGKSLAGGFAMAAGAMSDERTKVFNRRVGKDVGYAESPTSSAVSDKKAKKKTGVYSDEHSKEKIEELTAEKNAAESQLKEPLLSSEDRVNEIVREFKNNPSNMPADYGLNMVTGEYSPEVQEAKKRLASPEAGAPGQPSPEAQAAPASAEPTPEEAAQAKYVEDAEEYANRNVDPMHGDANAGVTGATGQTAATGQQGPPPVPASEMHDGPTNYAGGAEAPPPQYSDAGNAPVEQTHGTYDDWAESTQHLVGENPGMRGPAAGGYSQGATTYAQDVPAGHPGGEIAQGQEGVGGAVSGQAPAPSPQQNEAMLKDHFKRAYGIDIGTGAGQVPMEIAVNIDQAQLAKDQAAEAAANDTPEAQMEWLAAQAAGPAEAAAAMELATPRPVVGKGASAQDHKRVNTMETRVEEIEREIAVMDFLSFGGGNPDDFRERGFIHDERLEKENAAEANRRLEEGLGGKPSDATLSYDESPKAPKQGGMKRIISADEYAAEIKEWQARGVPAWKEGKSAYTEWVKKNPRPTMSDENSKKDKKLEEASDIFRGTPGYEFEYKEEFADLPGAGHGGQVGIMAQDLEKSGGESAVMEGPDGLKRVDTEKLTMMNSAALNEILARLDAMEGSRT